MMPGLPWQCAATTRSARPASSTIARSSLPENCWWIGWSTSLSTPPEAQILITRAFLRSWRRTALRQSGTPSHSWVAPSWAL